MSSSVFYDDEPPALTRVVAELEAPLFMGLEVRDLGHAFADMMLARRRLEQSTEPSAARELLHHAWKLFSGSALALWLCDLLDDRVELARTGHIPASPELDLAQAVAVRLAELLVARRRAMPSPPWREMATQAWTEAAEIVGARFDADRLFMTGSHRGMPFEARIQLKDNRLTTVIARSTGDASESLERSIEGLIAGAQALVDLIDELCDDSDNPVRGPYR